MSTAFQDKLLADGMRDIEATINSARDVATTLWCLAELTIFRIDHQLSEEQRDAFVYLIGEVDQANRRLVDEWNERWDAAMRADDIGRKAA